jgi:hypothetical protein
MTLKHNGFMLKLTFQVAKWPGSQNVVKKQSYANKGC